MTIDEGIQLCEYSAKTNEILMKRYDDASGYTRSGNAEIRTTDAKTLEKRAEEHRQFAAWLRELKERREQTSDDCISRQAVLSMQYRIDDSAALSTRDVVNVDDIEALPSVKPQEPKTGHWITVTNGRGGHECSLCHEYAPNYQSGDEWLTNYCPNCGAKMQEVEE